jgi:hypothetical protein
VFVLAQDDGLIVEYKASDTGTAADSSKLEILTGRNVAYVDLDDGVLKHLYSHSRYDAMAYEEWKRQVVRAAATDLALRKMLRRKPDAALADLVDPVARADIVQRLSSPSGMLVLAFHGGFSLLVRRLFTHLMNDSLSIAAGGQHQASRGAYVLLAAHRALRAGKTVGLAPDGRWGKQTGTIPVLGAHRSVSDGGPFLAHATRCDTAWFALRRSDGGFVPDIVAGPRHDGGETFAAFRERFFRFYAERIEAAFTGEPRSLSLTSSWAETFSAMLTGRAELPGPGLDHTDLDD